MSITIGKPAPDFSAEDQNGKKHSLKDLKGKTTLIYFYPKDQTPGCTVQACSLRDHTEELRADGIDVLGVSKDDVASHQKFASKHELPFPILADTDHKMIDDYDAWAEKSMYGRKFMGIVRSGVIVGPDLTILMHWPKLPPLKTVPEVRKWKHEQDA